MGSTCEIFALRRLCALSAARSRFTLGWVYADGSTSARGLGGHSGNGVVGSVSLAVGWFVRAVLAGNSSAVCNLGLCFEEGTGVTKDWAQAEQLYREAAEAGNTTALCSLGYLYTLQEQYEAVRAPSDAMPLEHAAGPRWDPPAFFVSN
jgi:TPR repeat protein